MSPERGHSRRELLQTGGALLGTATLGSLAGCTSESSDESDQSPQRLDAVPADASAVFGADAAALLADEGLKGGINSRLETVAETEQYTGPESVEGALGMAEDQAGVDPEQLDAFVLFADVEGDGYGGAVVWSGWSEDELLGALESNGFSAEEDGEYGGKTVYAQSGETVLGVLGDGQYVVGTQDAIEDVIDTTNGDANAISGSVREHYTATSGMVRFATAVPSSWAPSGGNEEIDPQPLENAEYVSGSLSKQGSDRRGSIRLHTDSESEASEIESVINDGVDLAQRQVEDTLEREDLGGMRPFLTDFEAMLGEMAVSTDGTTATLSYTGPPEDAALLLALPLGVLVNTAGFLQSRSEETGQRSSEQVASRLQVLQASGLVTETDGQRAIGTVQLIATKSPGEGDIDLTGVTMQWVDDTGTYDIVHESQYSGRVDGQFTVEAIKDDDDSLPVINSADDRARIGIDLASGARAIKESGLAEGKTASVRITTQSGTATAVRLTVPESLSGKEAVRL